MEKLELADPFTGLAIDALIVKNKRGYETLLNLKNSMIYPLVKVNDKTCVAIPLEEFYETPLVSSAQARDFLQVSKARIAQIVKLGRLHPVYIEGKQYFNKSDLVQYKNTRYKRQVNKKE